MHSDNVDPRDDPRRWWILLAIGMGSLMTALDGSVVNTILPILRRTFNSDVATIEWVVTIYLLTISGLLLGFGRLGDMQGNKRVYLWGFALFVGGSVICGWAPALGVLIAARALQALGGAMLSANSPAILTRSFPPSQRGRALGLQATMTYLGLVAGPSLGGWLATAYGWRSVFFINVPVGLLALGLGLWSIPQDRMTSREERFDFAGAALFTVGLVLLLLGMNRGHDWGWGALSTLGILGAASLLLGAFVFVEARAPYPMLALDLFRSRIFSAATVSAVFNYVCVYGILFLMPFYLIEGRGLTSARAGALLMVQPLVMAVAAPFSGTLSDRFGSRLFATLGMGVLALSLFLCSSLGADSSFRLVGVTLALSGLGVAFFTTPNASALLGAAPSHRQGIASGVMATARNTGMALGVGLSGAVLNTVLRRASLFEAIDGAFLALVVVALAGAVTSASRGGRG
ncbi:MAG: MFS transporter [Anaerolineae bacterium]